MLEGLEKYTIILASKSPRRQQLLKGLEITFSIQPKDVEEIYPENLAGEQIAVYLSELKARAFDFSILPENTLLITADTIVYLDNVVIGKPKNFDDAVQMLSTLSGKKHQVITGVCLKTKDVSHSFYAKSDVYFRHLEMDEIQHYVRQYKPYDKAGAYGIQEWIGYTGIERIEGSFYNVMGLPIQKLYTELLKFCE